DTRDPTPTSALLEAERRHEVVEEAVVSGDAVFAHLFADLELRVSPNAVSGAAEIARPVRSTSRLSSGSGTPRTPG
ncbi:MAG: hypothetical protein J6T51_08335, partial [Kiritimatiellae bacterium]|nr:hypothetical protein [Kiritimatiellia bacterium]